VVIGGDASPSWRARQAAAAKRVQLCINVLMKWIAGRHRPVRGIAPFTFHPFQGGWPIISAGAGAHFSFGDATLAFATAASLRFCCREGRGLFYARGIDRRA